jgi:hypothetical protein
MEWLNHIPALLKIFLVLGIVVIGLKFKLHLSFSLLIGSVFLAIFFRMTPPNLFKAAIAGIFSVETISLVIIVTGILTLSNGMSISGRLERIVDSFKKLVGESRIALVTFPALIGFLPMPGGAIFSAPMIGAMSQNTSFTPHHKTIINYWFRHVWEYWFPLYPGAILAISLTNIPAYKFILLGLPMSLVAIVVGYLIILRNVSLGQKIYRNYSMPNILNFLNELIPIFLMVFSLLLFGILLNILESKFDFKSKFVDRTPILIGLILSFSWIVVADKLKWKDIKSILSKNTTYQLGLLVIAIMIFRSILERSEGVNTLKNELLTYKIPISGLIMVLPFIAGIVTGIAVGFVGTSFPVVITLIATMNIAPENTGSLIFIAYVFGYTGMMLSPVHLCLLLTKDYFKANLLKVYTRYLIPIGVLTLIPALILFAVYHFFQF